MAVTDRTDWLRGKGEMAALIRAHPWDATPLGAMVRWPQSLRTAVELMLASAQPVYIGWGPDLVSLYNDGYIPIAGAKHPSSLGLPYCEMWPEIWDEFRPVAAAVMAGESRSFVDQPVPLAGRPGRPLSWFTFSWTPLQDDYGLVAGFYCAAVETTDRVLTDRERDSSYRALFETVDEGYLLADVIFDDAGKAIDIHYVDANPAATRMVGVDLKGRRLRDVSTEYEDYWYEIWGRVARTGVGERLERYAAPEQRWYDFYVFKPDPDDAESTRVAVLFHDASERKAAEAVLRESEERQAFLLELSDALRPLSDPVAIQQTAMRVLGEHLQVNRAFYGSAQDDHDTLLIGPGYSDGTFPLQGEVKFSDFDVDMAAWYQAGQTYIIEDTQLDTRFGSGTKASFVSVDVGAAIGIPLVKDGVVRAIVSLHQTTPRRWTDAEVALAEEVAERTWATVERARSEASLRESEERQAFLLTLSDVLAELNDPVAIEETASRLLGERLGALRVGYGEVAGDELVLRADYVNGVSSLKGRYPIDAFGTALAAVHRDGGTIVIGDAASDPSLTEADRDGYRSLGVAAHVTVAIRKAGRPIVSLGVQSDTPREWSAGEIALIHDVADRTWTVVGRVQADQALRDSEDHRAFLLELSDALRPLTSPSGIQHAAMKLLAERFDVMRAGYLDVDEDGDNTTMAAHFQRTSDPVPQRIRLSDYGSDLVAAFRSGQTRYLYDADVELPTEAERAAHRAIGIRAWIIAPLVKDGQLIAIVGVVSKTPRDWKAVQVQMVTDLAERTWDSAQRARTEEALRKNEERQALLLELSDLLRPLRNTAEIQQAAVRLLGEKLQVSRAGYYEVEADQNAFFLTARWEREAIPLPDRMLVTDFGKDIRAGYLAGRTMVASDTDKASATQENATAARAISVRAYIGVPLVKDGRWVAAVGVHSAVPRDWTIAEIKLVEEVGDRTWAAVERSRAEAALRESEARYRLLFDTIDEGFCLCERVPGDPVDFRYVVVNPAFDRQSGLDHPVGKTIRELVPDIDEATMQTYARVEETGRAKHFITSGGPLDRWFEVEAMPAGQPARIAILFRNVTDRRRADEALRESEDRLQILMQGIPQLVWRAVEDGQWTWASPQWTEFTGQSDEASHGLGWLETVHPDDRAGVQEDWAGAVEQGEFHADFRLSNATEGRYRWFQARATPVRDECGAIVEWLGTSTDVDDLRQLQDRQGVMVAELQHRTRNLITVVRAVSQQTIAEASSLPDFRERFGDRLAALSRVQGLLSHLSAGERVTFRSLICSELEALGAPAGKLTLDGPEEVPLRSATVQTFSLALHELATNALKYGALSAPPGHLTVRWHLRSSADGQSRLHVDWRETGVDITQVAERPRGGGYGRELIEHALPYQLDADTAYEMTEQGVHCTIDVPIAGARA